MLRKKKEFIKKRKLSLDRNGNRMKITQNEPLEPSLSASNTIYSYNAKRNRLQSAGSSNFGYDLEGQLSSKDSTVYSFDYAHRLKNVGGTDQYFYNGSDQRIKAVRNGVTTYYIYDVAGNSWPKRTGRKRSLVTMSMAPGCWRRLLPMKMSIATTSTEPEVRLP